MTKLLDSPTNCNRDLTFSLFDRYAGLHNWRSTFSVTVWLETITFPFFFRKYVKSFYWSVLTLMTIGETPSPQTNIVSDSFFYRASIRKLSLRYFTVAELHQFPATKLSWVLFFIDGCTDVLCRNIFSLDSCFFLESLYLQLSLATLETSSAIWMLQGQIFRPGINLCLTFFRFPFCMAVFKYSQSWSSLSGNGGSVYSLGKTRLPRSTQ